MKYFQSPPTTTLVISMLFFAYAIHRFAMKDEVAWIPITIGICIIAAGFGFSYWQYRQWQDDEETEPAESHE